MSYSATLPELFDDYALRLSKSLLKDNRRMTRRLSERGELTFKVINEPETFKKTIGEFPFNTQNHVLRINCDGEIFRKLEKAGAIIQKSEKNFMKAF